MASSTCTTEELYAYASGYMSRIDDDKSSPQPLINLIIKFHVEQNYFSSDGALEKGKNSDIIGEISSQYPCRPCDQEEAITITSYDNLSRMIARLKIPFSLEKLRWKGTRIIGSAEPPREKTELENEEQLIHRVLDGGREIVHRCSSCGKKTCFLDVYIYKIVYLPRHEIEAINRAKRKEERVLNLYGFVSWLIRENPMLNFYQIKRIIEKQVTATAPPRPPPTPEKATLLAHKKYERKLELQLLKRAVREYFGGHRSVPASRSSIQALKTVTYFEGDHHHIDDDDDGTKENEVVELECAICKDDILSGSQVTRMPCSHAYHRLCIAEWLKMNHMCPLCRFKLPTT